LDKSQARKEGTVLTPNIPPILRTQRYVVTKIVINDRGQPTKPPTSVVTGKLHDCWKFTPDALVTVEQALAFANEKGYDFVGYNLAGGSALCVDLDNCFQPNGELKLWARVFVDTWEGFIFYAERSPGVTHHGLHLWIRVDQKDLTAFAERMAGVGKKKVVKNVGADHEKIELFWSNYVTMTGNVWGEFDGGMLDKNGLEKLYTCVAGKDQAVAEVAGKRGKSAYSDLTLADMIAKPESEFIDASSAVASLLVKSALKNSCDPEKMEADLKQSKLYTGGKWGPTGENKWARRKNEELANAIEEARKVPPRESRSPEVSSLVMPDPGWTLRKPERWCWKPVLREAGMLNLSGESSQGKSPLTIDLCARMSKLPGHEGCGVWPDGQTMQNFPLHSIMLNNEDDLQDTILPRFDLAGGCDMFFHPITGVQVSKDDKTHQRMLALKEDIALISAEARKLAPHLGIVVIDPVTNYLGRLRMNQEEDVREALMPLVMLAQELRFNIITVSHLNKGESLDPMSRVMGARAFVGVARSAWQCSDDPDVEGHYAHIMSPIRGPKGHQSFRYHTEVANVEIEGEMSEVIKIVWDGMSKATASQALNPETQRNKSDTKKAGVVLRDFLKGGARGARECIDYLKTEGFDVEKLNTGRVRASAGAQSKLGGKNSSLWYLPTAQDQYEIPIGRKQNDGPDY
jgi:hypothetical protein